MTTKKGNKKAGSAKAVTKNNPSGSMAVESGTQSVLPGFKVRSGRHTKKASTAAKGQVEKKSYRDVGVGHYVRNILSGDYETAEIPNPLFESQDGLTQKDLQLEVLELVAEFFGVNMEEAQDDMPGALLSEDRKRWMEICRDNPTTPLSDSFERKGIESKHLKEPNDNFHYEVLLCMHGLLKAKVEKGLRFKDDLATLA